MTTLAAPQPGTGQTAEEDVAASGRRRAEVSAEDDERLVSRARAGDREAFDELAGRHASMLRRVLFRITKDCEAAWDAVQEALLSSWRNLSRFEGRSKFSTWLTRIGINEAYRGMRRGLPELRELDDSVGERVPDWGGRPDDVFESQEFLAAISEGLDRLSADHRAAVVARDVEGLSTTAAAAELGIGERALKSRLHRGRMALRAELDHYFDEDYVR